MLKIHLRQCGLSAVMEYAMWTFSVALHTFYKTTVLPCLIVSLCSEEEAIWDMTSYKDELTTARQRTQIKINLKYYILLTPHQL